MLSVSPAEFDVLSRNDLTTFIARTFAHLDPQTTYAHNWHIDLLADRLTRVYQGTRPYRRYGRRPVARARHGFAVRHPSWPWPDHSRWIHICVSICRTGLATLGGHRRTGCD